MPSNNSLINLLRKFQLWKLWRHRCYRIMDRVRVMRKSIDTCIIIRNINIKIDVFDSIVFWSETSLRWFGGKWNGNITLAITLTQRSLPKLMVLFNINFASPHWIQEGENKYSIFISIARRWSRTWGIQENNYLKMC